MVVKYTSINNLTEVGTLRGTSTATFGIPTKRLKITIYPILYHRWCLELLQLKQL